MLISTDLIIPFIPRVLQTQQTPPKLNISRVKKNEKPANDLTENKPEKDLSPWLLNHHQPKQEEPQQQDSGEQAPLHHIDIKV